MHYSVDIINELGELIDEKMVNSFNSIKDVYNLKDKTFQDLLDEIIDKHLNGSDDPLILKEKYNKLVASRRQQRFRWVQAISKNLSEYIIENPQSIFHHIYLQKLQLSPNNFQKLYATSNLDQAIETITQECFIWKESGGELFNFPLLQSLGTKTSLDYLCDDILYSALNIVVLRYESDLRRLLTRRPTELVEHNPFSIKKGKAPVVKVDGQNKAVVYQSENKEYAVNMLPVSVMDDRVSHEMISYLNRVDLDILSILINVAQVDYTANKVSSITIKLQTIATQLTNTSSPSEIQCKTVKERLLNMAANSVDILVENKRVSVYNLLDKVETPLGEEKKSFKTQRVNIKLGSILEDSLVQKKMITVPSSKYNQLNNDYAKLLYHRFQMDRVSYALKKSPDSHKLYDFIFFSNYLLLQGRKAAKKDLIKQALSEFVSKKILIENYVEKKDNYHIWFYPLSSSEKEDLMINYKLDSND